VPSRGGNEAKEGTVALLRNTGVKRQGRADHRGGSGHRGGARRAAGGTWRQGRAGGLEAEEQAKVAANIGRSAHALGGRRHQLDALEKATAGVVGYFGRIDIVIANAGIATAGFVRSVDPAAFEKVIEVDLLGRLADLPRHAAARHREQGLPARHLLARRDHARARHGQLLRREGRRRGVLQQPPRGGRAPGREGRRRAPHVDPYRPGRERGRAPGVRQAPLVRCPG